MSGDGQGWFWESPAGIRIQGLNTPHYSTDISDAWLVVETLSNYPQEVQQRFLDRLIQLGLLVTREVAASNICFAALSAIKG